jgi:cytochrome c oxidase subunit 4
MTDPDARDTRTSIWALLRRNGIIWLVLMAFLLTSFGAAYVQLGRMNAAVGPFIAVLKAGLVVTLFMELGRSRALIRLAALAGLLFLCVLYGLTLLDSSMRWAGD